MAKKIPTAADIIKLKNFSFPPFDTGSFLLEVAAFFVNNDVSDGFALKSKRFIDYPEPHPESGYVACLQPDEEEKHRKEVTRYYYVPEFLRTRYGTAFTQYPVIYINAPFYKNAIAALKMYGYVVGKAGNVEESFVYVTLV